MARSPLSPAGQNLFGQVGVEGATTGGGLGTMLQSQVGEETEEERKKRLLGISTMQTSPLAKVGSPFASASPAGRSLFGPGGLR
jgi:hypothetical protein